MNERIKDLLGQCISNQMVMTHEVDLNKFAELIVKECCTRIQGCHLAEGYDPAIVGDFELGYKRGIDKATTQVKKHFGIE